MNPPCRPVSRKTPLGGASECKHSAYIMKAVTLPLVQVGNSRGIRLPARLIAKHKLEWGAMLGERGDAIVLRAKKTPKKLSWEETYKKMAASDEDWSAWEAMRGGWDDDSKSSLHEDRKLQHPGGRSLMSISVRNFRRTASQADRCCRRAR